jgi:hypothetical protein
MNGGAWKRKDENTYGEGLFPFGVCNFPGCQQPACFQIPVQKADGFLVTTGQAKSCLDHKPSHVIFSPFLGQQSKLFSTNARRVLGGGGAGGSKSFAGSRLWLKQFSPENQRYLKALDRGESFSSLGWALFLRRTRPELLQTVDDFRRYWAKVDPEAKWNEKEWTCYFKCGFKVQFGGMQDESDWERYHGNAYTLVVMDEASQNTVKQIEELDSRIRCADPILDRMCQLYLLTNPIGAETKQYLKRRFVNVAPPETLIEEKTILRDGRVNIATKIYIPCNVYDNPSLVGSGAYEANLRSKGSNMQRALLENDWNVDEGAWIGDDWDPSVHVCEPFSIPATWARVKSGDLGFGLSRRAHRTSVLWFAIDPDGNVVCYRSLAVRGTTATQLGPIIRALESVPLRHRRANGSVITITDGEWDANRECSNVVGPMDAAAWGDIQETGQSRGEILDIAGSGFVRSAKGKSARLSSGDMIREYLRRRGPDSHGKMDPGIPGLRFFSTCRSSVKFADGTIEETGPIITIPSLAFDAADPDKWDTKGEDDDMDALGYFAISRPPAGREEIEEAKVLDFMRLRETTINRKLAW